jgi:hypothetical protein
VIGQNERRRSTKWPLVLRDTWDVLVATKDGCDTSAMGLAHLPDPEYLLHSSRTRGWAVAANEVIDAGVQEDRADWLLFCDDDIELTEWTLQFLPKYSLAAEVFGFTLVPSQGGMVSAGHVFGSEGSLVPQTGPALMIPAYVPHVTASCMLIKREVLEAGIRFPVWPGVHSEDVAFTLDCWLHGFRVAYLPGLVWHHMASPGVGATKTGEPDLDQKLALNRLHLQQWMCEKGIAQACADGRIPLGARPLHA